MKSTVAPSLDETKLTYPCLMVHTNGVIFLMDSSCTGTVVGYDSYYNSEQSNLGYNMAYYVSPRIAEYQSLQLYPNTVILEN